MANRNYKNEKLIWGHEGKRFDEDDVDDQGLGGWFLGLSFDV